MSYDLEIWSVRRFECSSLPKGQLLSGRDWQITINPSDKILPEDVEDEIAAMIPGIAYRTELNLEGNPPNQAFKLLQSTARNIAKETHGVVFDPQSDRITSASGVTRFVKPKKEKTFSVINFAWWFLNDVMYEASGRKSFITLLEKLLPEALPKRYGEYQPPQFVFAKTGKAHLGRFIKQHLHDVIVWYSTRPVTHVHVTSPDVLGASEDGFRTHLVEIQVECAALKQPGWPEHLQHFWRQMTFLLQPIYSEARTEGGYTFHGGTVYQPASALKETYPFTTRSWFWRGIPRKLGHAVAIGKEYQKLWPDFVKKASVENGFAFATTPDWLQPVDLSQVIGSAPKPIQLLPGKGMGREQRYPEIWPFGVPFRSE